MRSDNVWSFTELNITNTFHLISVRYAMASKTRIINKSLIINIVKKTELCVCCWPKCRQAFFFFWYSYNVIESFVAVTKNPEV